ncbi:MAG: 23S rRNA (uracil(1939)-C(5))-methyltransferase RlmD [Muricoprocola sp.]
MKKDDIITLKIEDLSSDGLGVGRYDGIAFFVKDAIIGDTVEAKVMKMKKTYGYARLIRLLEASPYRIEPPCPVARQCGGCQIQAMEYPSQLKFKEEKVRNNLMRIGKFEEIPMEPILGMEQPFRYRNKAQFPIGKDKDGNPVAGFYAGRTHTIIPVKDCLLGAPVNQQILEIVLSYMKENHVAPYDENTGTGLVRHVMTRVGHHTGQIMVCIVINGHSLPHAEKLTQELSGIPGMTSILQNTNTARTNVIMGTEQKVLWGSETIEDDIGDVRFSISARSFFQVNPVQTEKLYGKALEYAGLTGKETVWDLYCGIGTISLFMARNARQVCGVEIVPEAIQDARKNADLNGITNASFYVGKAEEVLPEKYSQENIHADVIMVDPPRKGCEESVLSTMLQMAPQRIVYVSCDSATLARDLRYLCDGGYELKRVCPVEMFGNSVHVETVCLLSKLNTK